VGVKVSAFAMTGIKFTLEPSLFITSISKGDNLVRQKKENMNPMLLSLSLFLPSPYTTYV
jgi:hypothetical protein